MRDIDKAQGVCYIESGTQNAPAINGGIKMGYLYETHMHTCLASACGRSTGKEHARFYKDAGYTGIILSDHFFGGNTSVDRSLPWEQRIDLFWKGYEDALEEGLKIGLDVFFGLEQGFGDDEYLIYGLSKEYMKSRPDMEHWTRAQQLKEVHAAGGCVIQAHPFRMRGYMNIIRVGADFADGVEVANGGNEQIDDARCMRFASARGLVMTAGSDNHHSPIDMPYGVELDEKLGSIQDYVKLILNHGKIGLHAPAGRFDLPDPYIPDERHIAYVLNAEENPVRRDDL